MKVLIWAGDGLQAREIQNTLDKVIKKQLQGAGYYFGHDTYVAQTKGVSREEIRVFLLSDEKSQRIPSWLEDLSEAIATGLSLNKSQVVCAVKFP